MREFSPVTAEDCLECLNQTAQVVDTVVGPVQYAVRGEGPVVIAVHGGPGGWDQGLVMAESFRKNGFRVLAVSRPGYLGTPLVSGASLEGQADSVAALMDALGLARAAVVGASAGGPPAYLLARRHPDKVAALIQIDSVALKYTKGEELSRVEEAIYLSKAGLWLMDFFARHFPSATVKSFLKTESTLDGHEIGERVKQVVGDPAKYGYVQALFATMATEYPRRKAGVKNDLKRLAEIGKLPLDGIVCPSLIMHGDADADVPYAHGEYAHGSIPGSELYTIDQGSHIGFWIADGARRAQAYAADWLTNVYGTD